MGHIDEHLKQTIDLVSLTTVFGTLMGHLPSVAAIFSIAWSIIRIYETRTVRDLFSKIRNEDKDNA